MKLEENTKFANYFSYLSNIWLRFNVAVSTLSLTRVLPQSPYLANKLLPTVAKIFNTLVMRQNQLFEYKFFSSSSYLIDFVYPLLSFKQCTT